MVGSWGRGEALGSGDQWLEQMLMRSENPFLQEWGTSRQVHSKADPRPPPRQPEQQSPQGRTT